MLGSGGNKKINSNGGGGSGGGGSSSSKGASALIGLWNSKSVMTPVLGPLGLATPSTTTTTSKPVKSVVPTVNVVSVANEGAPCSPNVKKPKSPFAKFRQMENQQQQQQQQTIFNRNTLNLPTSAPPPIGYGGSKSTSTSPNMAVKKPVPRSASSAKETLLLWIQQKINHYDRVNVTNFSSSWSDGLAFCALIHVFYPEAFNFEELSSTNRGQNFTIAFKAAEEYGDIYPLLDVEDMVKMKIPDWKCVFTYVQSFYRRFRDGREKPKNTRTLILNTTGAGALSAAVAENERPR